MHIAKLYNYDAFFTFTLPYIDVNECALNIDDCDQLCVNDFGSYHCECYSGYLRENNSLPCIG